MSDLIKRREFIVLLGGAAVVWPLAARAQERHRIPRVGVLWHAASAEEEGALFPARVEGFVALGYIDGQNIILEHRFPNEMPQRFRSMAAELVSLNVDVLISSGNNAAPYAKNATATIPLVLMFITDPVGTKLVESLARPGGNATGLSFFSSELIGKRLQFLKETIPGLSRVPDLVTELVRLKVDLIVTRGTPPALAAKRATGTIPVVMAAIGDPLGIVASLARPGGNVTGLSAFTSELEPTRIELIREIIPGTARIAALYNMANPIFLARWEEMQRVSKSLGVQPLLLDVRKPEDLERAFDTAITQRADALVVSNDGLMLANGKLIVELAVKHRLPAVYAAREFRTSRDRRVISPDLRTTSTPWPASGWDCSGTSLRVSRGWQYCSIRTRLPLGQYTCGQPRRRPAPSGWR